MTWPPAELPIDFENATPQENTHPDAHNTTNQTINADIVPEINRVGALADTIGLYLPLTGGTLTGDLQVDGLIDGKLGPVPADAWGTESGSVFTPLGAIGNSQGSYGTAMTSNGYRNIAGGWTSLGLNNSVGATTMELLPTGTFWVRTAATMDGSATNPPVRFAVTDSLTRCYYDLQVDGQIKAQNGTKSAPAYSFTSDPDTGIYLYSAGITSITCAGKNIANFGLDGVAFPEGLATITGTAANLHIGENGQIRRITDVAKSPTTADVSRLETVIETLTARIEELEARLKPAATDV